MLNFQWPVWESESDNKKINTPAPRAVQYDYIYQMDEIKSLSFHIMFYRLFRGVAKYIVYSNTFSSFEWLRSLKNHYIVICIVIMI